MGQGFLEYKSSTLLFFNFDVPVGRKELINLYKGGFSTIVMQLSKRKAVCISVKTM